MDPVDNSYQALVALAVGHVTLDRVALPDGGEGLRPGGSAWYAARAWHALGVQARLATAVGADFDQEAAFAGLQAEVARAGETTVFTNQYPDTGPRVQYVETCAPEVRPGPPQPVDVLLLAPVIGEISLTAWANWPARIRAAGLQGWLKYAEGEGPGRRRVGQSPSRLSPEALQGLDVVTLSEEDLAGDEAWLARLVQVVPCVALTLGDQGARVFVNGQPHPVGVYPCTPVDPTGAGDTFTAGMVLGLAQGLDPVEAAWLGAAAASVVVEHPGAAPDEAMAQALGRFAAGDRRSFTADRQPSYRR